MQILISWSEHFVVFAFPVKVQYVVSLKTSKQIPPSKSTYCTVCLYWLREECNMNIHVIKHYMCAVWSALTFLISRGSVYKVPGCCASLYPSHESSSLIWRCSSRKNRLFNHFSGSVWWKYALFNSVNCSSVIFTLHYMHFYSKKKKKQKKNYFIIIAGYKYQSKIY